MQTRAPAVGGHYHLWGTRCPGVHGELERSCRWRRPGIKAGRGGRIPLTFIICRPLISCQYFLVAQLKGKPAAKWVGAVVQRERPPRVTNQGREWETELHTQNGQ